MPFLLVMKRTAILFVLAFLCLSIAVAVILKRPDDARAKVFFLLLFTVSLVFITFGAWSARDLAMEGKTFLFLYLINDVYAFPYFPVIFLHFCLIFPAEKRFILAHRRIFLVTLYVIPALDGLVFLPRIFFYGYSLLWGCGLLGGIAAMVHGYVSQKSALVRAQMKWILWGTAVFSVGMFFTYTVPIILNSFSFYNSLEYYSYILPSFFFMAIPLSFAFAIVRYRLMDIDILFDTTFIYILVLTAFFLLDVALSSIFTFLNIREARIVWPVQTILILWLILAFYVPLREKTTYLVKKVLKREFYEINEVSLDFGKKLLASRDEQEAVGTFAATLKDLLRPKDVWALFFREMPVDKLSRAVVVKGRSDYPLAFGDSLRSLTSPRQVDAFLPAVAEKENRLSEVLLAGVAVPLAGLKEPLGVLILGEKESKGLYNSNDIKLLTLLTSQLSLSLESIANRREAEKQEIESLRERTRLSREIHDGIGGSFSSALMLVDVAEREAGRESGGGGQAQDRLRHLREILSEGFMELRNLIWTIEENEDSLGNLAAYLRGKLAKGAENNGVEAAFETRLEDEGFRLPAAFRLNLIRIVQELLANAIKHAGASRITFEFAEQGGRLSLRFSDDGRGFDPSSPPGKGYGLRNMRKRCEELGGAMTVASSSDGTRTEMFFLLKP